jgi:thiosulfate/3-mercaptopyruvate sulfurtransferase
MRHFTTLLDANTLFEQLSRDDLTIFDCRFDLSRVQWGEAEYSAAHLPGAHYLHLDRDLSSPITTDTGRHPLPDPDRFARRLGELGVDAHSQLVAYDQGN